MWLVVELDDEELSQQFCSFVPESYVHMKNMRLYCYWPKTNAGAKIRSAKDPKESGISNFTIYSCRVLMNGEKFKTYNEARDAEKIAQNYSTLTEYNLSLNKEQIPKRQKEVPNNFKNKISESFTIVDMGDTALHADEFSAKTSSEEIVEDFITGNDSLMFNGRIKYEDYSFSNQANLRKDEQIVTNKFDKYGMSEEAEKINEIYSIAKRKRSNEDVEVEIKKSKIVESESEDDDGDHTTKVTCPVYKDWFGSSPDIINSPSNENAKPGETLQNYENQTTPSDYSFLFKENEVDILTSTPLEELPQSNATLNKGVAVSNSIPDDIANSALQRALSNIAKIELSVSSFISDVQQQLQELRQEVSNYMVKNRNIYLVPVSEVQGFQDTMSKSVPVKETVPNVRNGKAVVQNIEFLNRSITRDEVVDANSKIEKNDVKENVAKPSLVQDETFQVINVEPTTRTPIEIDQNVVLCSHLPISNPKQYEMFENLLEEFPQPEEVLIEYLSPLVDEKETKYMDRTIGKLFTEDFFLDYISWKNEGGRVLIKNSNILKCWQESYAKLYLPDEDDKKFKAHFRRCKSTKRAGRKGKP